MNAIVRELESVDLRFISQNENFYTAEIETDNYFIVAEFEVLETEYSPAEPSVGIMSCDYRAVRLDTTITAIYNNEGEEIKGDFTEIEAYLSKNAEIDLREAI